MATPTLLQALAEIGAETGADRCRVAELARAGMFEALATPPRPGGRRPGLGAMPALRAWGEREGLL